MIVQKVSQLMRINPRRVFLLKSVLAGIIGGKALSFYWGFSSETFLTPLVNYFQEYFGVVLVIWLMLGHNLKIKNWLFAGFVGSLIYSLFLVFGKLPVIPFSNSGEFLVSIVNFVKWVARHMFAAAIGSAPQWIVASKYSSKAYIWIFANALGYGLFAILPYLQIKTAVNWIHGPHSGGLSGFYQFINYISVDPVASNLIYLIGHGIFGLMLGYVLLNLFEYENINYSTPSPST